MGKEVLLYDVTADAIRHLEEYLSIVETCAPFSRQRRLIQQIGDTIGELQTLQQLQPETPTTVELLDRLEWSRANGAPLNAVSTAYRKYPPPFPLLPDGSNRLYRRPGTRVAHSLESVLVVFGATTPQPHAALTCATDAPRKGRNATTLP